MRVAVVGATGLVGKTMTAVLEERAFPVDALIPVGSARSVGKQVSFRGKSYSVTSLEGCLQRQPDVALFSAGSDVSREWAPKFAEQRTCVIDNSSAWRMDPAIKLIVPEVNGSVLQADDYIIANPNCSTIQMVVTLAPLHQQYGIRRLVISTYQSITGTGKLAVDQYESEKLGNQGERVYPYPIFANCLPHCDIFLENGYTKEEMKLVHETRKILSEPDLPVTATAVRVPVLGGHSESVNIEFERRFEIEDVRSILRNSSGITVLDDPARNLYPMPLTANGKDDVFVGRIRRDESRENTLNLWIVSDNLRKGAATNAIQIAEYMLQNQLLNRVQVHL